MRERLSASYPYEPGGHTGHRSDEEEQFRHRQNPIATHVRLNCLDESLTRRTALARTVNERLIDAVWWKLSPVPWVGSR